MKHEIERMQKELSRNANKMGRMEKRIEKLEAMLKNSLLEAGYIDEMKRQKFEENARIVERNLDIAEHDLKESAETKTEEEGKEINTLILDICNKLQIVQAMGGSAYKTDKDMPVIVGMSEKLLKMVAMPPLDFEAITMEALEDLAR
jgi:hypothetical protein